MLSAGAILFGLSALREGKVSAVELAGYFCELDRCDAGDQVVTLQERIVRKSPELIESLMLVSFEAGFVPIYCSGCGTHLRALSSQVRATLSCPLCEGAVVVPEVLFYPERESPVRARAAEAEAFYDADWPAGRFAHFDLRSPLGAGGTGKVYEAVNRRTGRKVALKIMKFLPLELRSGSLKRLMREARLAASISHPGIVKVYDMGMAEGVPYVEMGLAEGGCLRGYVKENGPLGCRQACRLMREVLAALSKAHAAGVVHRDFKPGNVLLDAQGHPVLADFGLSKLLSESTSTSTANRFVGSPHFMAPEQWNGSEVGPRTDIYAAGLALYYMLTGQLAFDDRNTLSIMYKHLHAPAPDVREEVPETPDFVAEAIFRAASKNPAERFASAEEFSTALEGASW